VLLFVLVARPARAFSTATAARPASSAPLTGWQSFKKHWLMDPACYPIMAIITGACTMVVIAGTRQLVSNPDVRFDKHDREEVIRHNEAAARNHLNSRMREHAAKEGASQPMFILNKLGNGTGTSPACSSSKRE
jgi:hypothetical protein